MGINSLPHIPPSDRGGDMRGELVRVWDILSPEAGQLFDEKLNMAFFSIGNFTDKICSSVGSLGKILARRGGIPSIVYPWGTQSSPLSEYYFSFAFTYLRPKDYPFMKIDWQELGFLDTLIFLHFWLHAFLFKIIFFIRITTLKFSKLIWKMSIKNEK